MTGAEEVPDGAYQFVAKIQFGELSDCTGVLVDRRWVLPAKNCFGTVSAPAAPTQATTVLLGRIDLTKTAGHRYLADWIIPNPDRNVALVELSAPVTDIAPARLGAAPAAGASLRIAGYGRTSTDWVPDRLHAGTFTVQSAGTASIGVAGDSSGATLCKGDAGGPAFRVVSGGVELVGISDTSW